MEILEGIIDIRKTLFTDIAVEFSFQCIRNDILN